MPKRIPERWEQYTPIGNRIPGTKFICFKVPLKLELCESLPRNLWFTPAVLMNKVRNLGLIIDLTNTTRYYLPKEFTDRQIKYDKVMCEGRIVPGQSVVQRFFQLVEDYLHSSGETDNLIGVHCTHGVNRTGYLVCLYMIRRMGFSPANAILEFNKARGYDIERINYLDSLKSSRKEEAHFYNHQSYSSERQQLRDGHSGPGNSTSWRQRSDSRSAAFHQHTDSPRSDSYPHSGSFNQLGDPGPVKYPSAFVQFSQDAWRGKANRNLYSLIAGHHSSDTSYVPRTGAAQSSFTPSSAYNIYSWIPEQQHPAPPGPALPYFKKGSPSMHQGRGGAKIHDEQRRKRCLRNVAHAATEP